MDAVQVRAAKAGEQDAVLATITLAFAADPVIRYWWRRPDVYLRGAPPFILAMGERGFEHGGVTVAGDFEGAAMWLPPGVEPDPERLRALDTVPRTEQEAEVSAELREAMAAYHPGEPHWYLWMIGVDPRRQGRGVGSAMLKHTLSICDERGDMAYLESSDPKNVPLYERHGFEVMGVIRVRDVPPITPMIRPPRR